MSNNSLRHFGIKGMHWGVRRMTDLEKGGRDAKNKLYDLKRHSLLKDVNHRQIRKLTDQEAIDLMKRVDVNQSYKKLTDRRKREGIILTTLLLAEIGSVAYGALKARQIYRNNLPRIGRKYQLPVWPTVDSHFVN